ncbi:DUF3768 domain-containing protein [Rhizobium sp. NPDC090275]|uniref:DUF3768 domain-containing protein n=1 Tax=Rhizobium sp. NPDC090275 TaxID=3364498 RepID=UPI00383ABC1F
MPTRSLITPPNTDAAHKAAVIRQLNDGFRRSFTRGNLLLTPAVDGLDTGSKAALLTAVQQFDRFNTDNDPYGEHDFGAIDLGAACYLWKIDYYDPDLQFGSADPADEAVTCRVMTIMRADEY